MCCAHSGRHEFGRNFLIDADVIGTIVDLTDCTTGPILEIGSGTGALTLPLQSLGRPITAVDIDPHLTAGLRRRCATNTSVVTADILGYRWPTDHHVVVGNLPFHLTTAILRKLLATRGWSTAVLVVQWEVARRRAAVGGATLMTAQWWPWFEFEVVGRVPASAFRPRPGVDGGILVVRRRKEPLLAPKLGRRYASFAHRVFTGKGSGVPEILDRAVPPHRRREVRALVGQLRLTTRTMPRDLTAEHWARLFEVALGHPGPEDPARELPGTRPGRYRRKPG